MCVCGGGGGGGGVTFLTLFTDFGCRLIILSGKLCKDKPASMVLPKKHLIR